ncbi:MAG: fibronectin type III domain-containing protein [Spirochaetales bacterium]|jgi:hypothetical protein|nr:fibronectin type III domain-containing protein [Spirochaetales bacterium]
MKKLKKLMRIIAIGAIIVASAFAVAGCDTGTDSGGGGGNEPSAPTGVSATAQSSSSINVSWNSVSGATSYKVYYTIGSSSTKNLAGTVTGASYTHTGLTADTSYSYYITAVNSEGESAYSSGASATTSSSGNGNEADPFLLSANIWADGEITSTTPNSEVWYTFNVTSGTTYYIWLNDSLTSGGADSGDGSKTLSAMFSAYYADGSSIFSSAYTAFTTPREFTADKTGAVKIKVFPWGSGTGTYGLAYSTAGARPNLNITLTVTANGSAHYTTTRVTMASNIALIRDDFVISGVPGVTIDSWNGTTRAPFSCWLNINGFTQGGELNVTLQKTGYTVSDPQPVTIYYAGSGWKRDTTSPSFSPNAIAYRGGRFVCVGSASSSAWSTNGVTWNNVNISSAVFSYTAITAGSVHFIAVGRDGRIALTTNGTSWTLVSPPPFSASLNGVIYGGGKVVVVGDSGKAAYFTDAIAISALTVVDDMKFGASHIYDVVYGGGKFVAVGAGGKASYSSDGITWYAVSDSKFGDSAISTIAYGDGKFVAAGQSGKAAYSSDGITWYAIPDTTFSSSDIEDIAYGGGKFVAVGGNANTAYSTDGITWTAIEDYFYSSYDGGTLFNFITYGSDRFVAGNSSTAYWITP